MSTIVWRVRSYRNLRVSVHPLVRSGSLTWGARICVKSAMLVFQGGKAHRCVVDTIRPPEPSAASRAATSPTFLVCLDPPRRARPEADVASGDSSSSSRWMTLLAFSQNRSFRNATTHPCCLLGPLARNAWCVWKAGWMSSSRSHSCSNHVSLVTLRPPQRLAKVARATNLETDDVGRGVVLEFSEGHGFTVRPLQAVRAGEQLPP